MGNARRAGVKIYYRSRDISRSVNSFTYNDNYDKTDDISVTFEDRAERWIGEWFPAPGEKFNVWIELFDWRFFNDNRSIELGDFEIDNPEFSDVVTINAVTIPITSDARSEKKNRAWRQITLSGIAGDIAANTRLRLVYDTDIDPFYDSADQNDKSDLCFLEDLCKSDGLCMKTTNGRLIVFEERKYEAMPAVTTIRKGSSRIIETPTFRRNSKDVYKACEVAYFDPKTDETYRGYFSAPNVSGIGHTLRLRERYNSVYDDMNLNRKAAARLREKNRNEFQCSMSLKGDIIYFSGINVEVVGWQRLDGKYHIAGCRHTIDDSGYSVALEMRRCLEGY